MTLSILCVPRYAYAEDDLHITDWVVDASLMETGDLRISEDITYEFNDEFNGVYRDIVLDKTSGVADVKVAMVNDSSLSDYSLVSDAENGDRDVFTLEKEKNKIIIKIFSPSEDETKTFRISYIVNKVAVKYNDTGELYYKFLGKENETSIDNFIVNISLPDGDDTDKIKVYAHGPKNGVIEQINPDLYRLKVENVSSNVFIEARILFPAEFIVASTNIENQDRYQEAMDEEAAFQKKLVRDVQRRNAARGLFNNVTLVISVLSAFALMIVWYQCRRHKNNEILTTEFSDLTADSTPAAAAYITGMFYDSNAIFATILDLFRKGYLRIGGKDDSTNLLRNDNFVIYKIKDADLSLVSHERYFMNWLFYDMGNGNEVSTNDIKYYSKHSSQKFLESQATWKKKIKAEAEQLGYYDHGKKAQGSILVVLSVLHFVLGIVTAVLGSLYALLSFVIGIVLLIYGISLFYRLSDQGYLQYKKWMSFKKYMQKQYSNISKDEALDSLDPTLIYALGLSIIKKLKSTYHYDEIYTTNSWVFWYFLFASSNDNSFRTSINHSFAGSDISSSSGSFSAGGGGGAGGGGSGGF